LSRTVTPVGMLAHPLSVQIAPAAGPLVDAHIWSGRITAPAFAVNRTASPAISY
jgi:hypothetical protein